MNTSIMSCLETHIGRGSSRHVCLPRFLLSGFIETLPHDGHRGVLGYPMNQWFGLILKGQLGSI